MISDPVHVIPTIDFSAFRGDDLKAKAKVVAAIGKASENYGFMSLVGHGLSMPVIDQAFEAGRNFFAQPEVEKRKVVDQGTMRGYVPIFDVVSDGERPSAQEAFCMGHPVVPSDPEIAALPLHATTPWPELHGFREKVEAGYDALWSLGQDVMRAFAVYLGQAEDFFDDMSQESYSNLRINHYPPSEAVADVADYGVRPHVDQGLITLLLQDVNAGLFVYGPNEQWLPVTPNPNAVVVNVGNMLRRWTNGRFRAALHMVINDSGNERYSMPLFVHPSYSTVVDPRTLVGEEPQTDEFERVVAGEQVYARFKAERRSWRENPVYTVN